MAFLIQFNDENDKSLFCNFHKDCNTDEKQLIYQQLLEIALEDSISLNDKGSFTLKQKEDQVEIHLK